MIEKGSPSPYAADMRAIVGDLKTKKRSVGAVGKALHARENRPGARSMAPPVEMLSQRLI